MAINTGKIQGVHVVRELLKDLRAFGSITLPAVHTQLGLSLNAENAIRAYYSVKNFKKSIDILLAQVDLDEVHRRETGETTGIRADLTDLNTSINSFLSLVETNQSVIFATMTLGTEIAQYGNLTAGQRNALITAIQAIAANFSG